MDPAAPHSPRRRVLAVEDDPDILRQIQFILERGGYAVGTARTGREAVIALMRDRFDLVISDIMMPEMDGMELLDYLRRDPSLATLPVILLTAKTQDSDVMAGYQAGADMYLTKPFDPAELLSFVQRILG